jgi:hypothetical protein
LAAAQMPMTTIDLGIRQTQQRIFLRQALARSMAASTAQARPARSPGTIGSRSPSPRLPSRSRASGTSGFAPVAPYLMPKQLAQRTPAHSKEAERFFAGLLGSYSSMAQRKGVQPNDVSRAASFIISSLLYISNDGRVADAAQLEGLRRQMREIFSSDPEFQRLSNRQRQELYESYVIQAMHLTGLFEDAKRQDDKMRLREIQLGARRNIEELLGVRWNAVQLTQQGIVFAS